MFFKGDEDTWSNIALKKFDSKDKAHYALLQALNDDDISRVIHYTITLDIWSHLIVTHEGRSQVKRSKIVFVRSQYENFSMKMSLLMI